MSEQLELFPWKTFQKELAALSATEERMWSAIVKNWNERADRKRHRSEKRDTYLSPTWSLDIQKKRTKGGKQGTVQTGILGGNGWRLWQTSECIFQHHIYMSMSGERFQLTKAYCLGMGGHYDFKSSKSAPFGCFMMMTLAKLPTLYLFANSNLYVFSLDRAEMKLANTLTLKRLLYLPVLYSLVMCTCKAGLEWKRYMNSGIISISSYSQSL